MIRFEINQFPFALTNDQFETISGIVANDLGLDYDVVEGDTDGIVWLWVHREVLADYDCPARHWIETDGTVTLSEDVDWDWQGGSEPGPPRVEMEALYPRGEGETAAAWTNRALTHSREHGVNRQCTIGYHGECSDRAGESCRCLCHDDATRWYTVEGHPVGEGHAVTRAEQGRHHWPPAPGEPEYTWAHWVMAADDHDARVRAIKKQEATRG